MQRIVIEDTLPIEVEKAWNLLTDVNNYPKYMKFVLKIKDPPSVFQEGVCWTDITSIAWVPLSIEHKIIKVEKNKKFTYEISLPFGGMMIEECELIANREGARVHTKIEFSFKNYFLEFIFKIIFDKRFREMVEGTSENIKANYS